MGGYGGQKAWRRRAWLHRTAAAHGGVPRCFPAVGALLGGGSISVGCGAFSRRPPATSIATGEPAVKLPTHSRRRWKEKRPDGNRGNYSREFVVGGSDVMTRLLPERWGQSPAGSVNQPTDGSVGPRGGGLSVLGRPEGGAPRLLQVLRCSFAGVSLGDPGYIHDHHHH